VAKTVSVVDSGLEFSVNSTTDSQEEGDGKHESSHFAELRTSHGRVGSRREISFDGSTLSNVK
jgi:hypothetical protein